MSSFDFVAGPRESAMPPMALEITVWGSSMFRSPIPVHSRDLTSVFKCLSEMWSRGASYAASNRAASP